MSESRFRVCLFTGQDIGYDLVAFLGSQADIDLRVFSYETNNDRINGYRSAIALCRELGIRCTVAPLVNDSVVSSVGEFDPDIILSAYFAKLFPTSLMEIPRLGTVNVHPGRLPEYRGEFPTAWALVNGETEFGITLHYIDAGVDTGDILVQEVFPILPDETGYQLYTRSMKLGATMLIDNLPALLNGQIAARRQSGTGSCFGRFPARYQVGWKAPRVHIARQIRAHASPYFPAYSFLHNKCVLFNKASVIDPDGYTSRGPGRIQQVLDDRKFIVSCADGCLLIEDYLLFPPASGQESQEHIKTGNQFSDI